VLLVALALVVLAGLRKVPPIDADTGTTAQ